MRRIGNQEVLNVFDARQREGHHVDSRLLAEVNNPGEMYLLRLEDEDSFLSLIWQEADPARLLTPRGMPRTMRDVACRLLEGGHTFDTLSSDLGLNRNQHRSEWFEPCRQIDRAFDYSQFGWLVVVPACDSERNQSPSGSLYLFDGMHKSLVLAKRLICRETPYQVIEALYLLPRRH